MHTQNSSKTILFYDGDCALCQFWVQFCLERDRKKILFFAPLLGQTAQGLVPPAFQETLGTVVLWDQGQILIKSTAILTALGKIGYAPDLLFLIRLLPTRILDLIYDWVAQNRQRWFGKPSHCPLPPSEQQSQLLD
jgi:predicted DCC family thiol-disulfide oxidoreductase YuxK